MSVVATLLRGLKWLVVHRRRRAVWVGALALAGLVAARRATTRSASAAVEPTARCALLGYSTVAEGGLRLAGQGSGARLGHECGACGGDAVIRSNPGATFRFIRDLACQSPSLVARGGTVTFLGGGNDDLLSWTNGSKSFGHMALEGLAFIDEAHNRAPRLTAYRRFRAEAAEASLLTMNEQERLLREAVTCVRDAGGRFVYVHDYQVFDLEEPLSAARREMHQRRRAAVEESGGTFVDLHERFAGDIGVSWFNDFRHPSVIAHERFAKELCAHVSP